MDGVFSLVRKIVTLDESEWCVGESFTGVGKVGNALRGARKNKKTLFAERISCFPGKGVGAFDCRRQSAPYSPEPEFIHDDLVVKDDKRALGVFISVDRG